VEEYDNPRVAMALRGLLPQLCPDLLHVTHFGYLSTSILAAARELDIPYVVTFTDMWAICPAGLLLRSDQSLCSGPQDWGECLRCYGHMGPRGMRYAALVRWLPTWTWRGLIALARRPLATHWRYGHWLGAVERRSRVIRERLLAAGPKLRFGYAGALEPHKGAHLPLEALTLLAPTEATLSYWGPLPAPEKAYGQSLAQRIAATAGASHRGPYPHEQLKATLQELDVLIVPSLCYENTPTVIYEALASGMPVIASDQGGMRELVQTYRGGWLFPRGDARALARLMAQLIADRDAVRRMAEGILPVPDFAAHVDQVLRVYRERLGDKPA